MNLWFETFVLLGACFILKYGAILNFIRNPLKKIPLFKEFFSCALCMGFWIGLIFGIPFNGFFLFWGFYSAAICWLADYCIIAIQNKIYPN